MAHRKVLADTSIVIEHLRKRDKTKSVLFGAISNYKLFLSSVSIFELFVGATTDGKKNDIEYVLSAFNIVPFTSKIALKSAEIYLSLRSVNQILEIKDIFIGATGIVYNMPLLTLNIKHFERIPDLSLV